MDNSSCLVTPPHPPPPLCPPPGDCQTDLPGARCLLLLRSDMDALGPGQIRTPNLRVANAAATVLGLLPKLMSLRDVITRRLPDDRVHLDRLELCALALLHIQALYAGAAPRHAEMRRLSVEAHHLRRHFQAGAKSLLAQRLLCETDFKTLKRRRGHRNAVEDLLVFAHVFRTNWPSIANRSAISAEDVERAEHVALRLASLCGPSAPNKLKADRDRAFTLFALCYSQVRCAVSYVRWFENDADQFAPGLTGSPRVTRTPKAKRANSAAQTSSAPPVSEEPKPTEIPPGMPGSSPFIGGWSPKRP